jgi:hypothetical protein
MNVDRRLVLDLLNEVKAQDEGEACISLTTDSRGIYR